LQTWRTPADAAGSLADLAWWDLFQDESLRSVLKVALAQNSDLRLAVARVSEARAQLGIARSSQFPTIDASADFGRRRISEVGQVPIPAGVAPESDFWATRADMAFEIDFWGRLLSLRLWAYVPCATDCSGRQCEAASHCLGSVNTASRPPSFTL
jgi:multidrug efflux system outer membrane protein